GGIDEHHLPLRFPGLVRSSEDTPNRGASGLGSRRRDGHLVTDQPVHQGRFAHVGPTDHRHETGSQESLRFADPAVTTTSATLRPCIRATDSEAESTWKVSSSSGTRSARPNTRPPTVSQSPSGSSASSSRAKSST